MIHLNVTDATRVGLNLLALAGIAVVLHLGMPIFIPMVIAILLAAMLWPAAVGLHRGLHLPWGLACTVVITGLIVLILLVTFGATLAVTRIVQKLPNPNDEAAQAALYSAFRDRLAHMSPVPLDNAYLPRDAHDSRVFQYVRQTLEKGDVTNALLKVALYGNYWFWEWVMIMFILLFLMLEGRMLTRRIVEIFGPSREVQASVVEALTDMAFQVRNYLVWRTIVNFGLGVVVGVVYSLLGLQQAWTWALLTAILCYVPYLGPIAAGVPPVLDAFISCPNPWYAVILIVFYVGIITLEGYIIVPVVMGRSMEMNATTVMLACLFWEVVWGLSGLFLAMPLMAAVKAICYHVPGWRPWANLMGTDESAGPPETEPLVATADAVLPLTETASHGDKRKEPARTDP